MQPMLMFINGSMLRTPDSNEGVFVLFHLLPIVGAKIEPFKQGVFTDGINDVRSEGNRKWFSSAY